MQFKSIPFSEGAERFDRKFNPIAYMLISLKDGEYAIGTNLLNSDDIRVFLNDVKLLKNVELL